MSILKSKSSVNFFVAGLNLLIIPHFLIIPPTACFEGLVSKATEPASNNRINRKGLPKLCCKTQWNLEIPLFQAFFSTYVPEKAFLFVSKTAFL